MWPERILPPPPRLKLAKAGRKGWLIRLMALSASAVILASPLCGLAWAEDEYPHNGPLRSKNHHPIFLVLLNPSPEAAGAVSAFSWEVGVNHSNLFLRGAAEPWRIHMDKEVTELDFTLRAPLAALGVELGMELPVLSSWAGFMDSFVRRWHAAIGVPGYSGQELFPDNYYADKLEVGPDLFYRGRHGQAFVGDITCWLKGDAGVWRGHLFSWQAFLQAPTGPYGAGLGSGYWEYGGRIMARGDYIGIASYFSLGVYFPNRIAGVETQASLVPIYSGFMGLEWELWSQWTLLAQLTYTTSPMADRGLVFFSDPWIDMTVGFKRSLGLGKTLGLGLSENLNQTAPDFTLHLSLAL